MADPDPAIQSTPAAQPRRRLSLSLGEWLSVAQLVALLIGGAWAAFLFMKFEAVEKRLSRETAEQALRKLKAAPVKFDQKVSVWPYGRALDDAARHLGTDYQYTITNTTNQKIFVAMVVGHAFILAPLNNANADTVEVPPVKLLKASPWRRVASRAHLADGEELEGGVVKSAQGDTFVPERGGGGTGALEPGESRQGTISLIVRAPAADYVGFMLDAFIRLENGDTRWVGDTHHARLNAGPDEAPAARRSGP